MQSSFCKIPELPPPLKRRKESVIQFLPPFFSCLIWSFLLQKGLTQMEINEAFARVHGPAQHQQISVCIVM
jgi:hypothetical protein